MAVPLKNTTAILIFANSSGEEQLHKQIYKGAHLFETLTQQTLKTVSNTKLPYFHFTEKQQYGNTFGERFTNAIQAIFDKGYEHIITVGNDSPNLKTAHILEAEKQVKEKNFVLGPSTDGGFYLMGLRKSQFEASTFKNLAWQTSNLTKQLYRLISKQAVKIIFLERLFDIDSAHDVEKILKYAKNLSSSLLLVLLQTLGLKEEIYTEYASVYTSTYSNTLHNKGSPVLL